MWSGDNALVVEGKQERETEMETQRENTNNLISIQMPSTLYKIL